MATLADAGQRTTNESNPFPYADPKIQENNPYSQALQGGAAANVFAGQAPDAKGPYTPAELGPGSIKYQQDVANAKSSTETPDGSKGLIGAGLARLSGSNALDPDDSVKDTPEAASPTDAAKQQGKANAVQLNDALTGKKASVPTAQQNINAALAPDQAILDSLPAEYKSTMAQLAPYINSGQNTGDPALNAADAAVAKIAGDTNDPVEAALKQLPKDSKEYAKSVETQPIIQALLGFGKYEETYAGAQPTGQSAWSDQMSEIYKYLSGSNASTDGLGSPTSAAATAGSSNVATDTGAGGGNG